MRAANTAIPAKAQNVATSPTAPATAPPPRYGRTEALPDSEEQEGCTEPRRWPLVEDRDGPDEDNPREHDVGRAEERSAEVCREKGARSGGQQPDRCSHAKERGAKRCDQPEPPHEVASESAGKT